MFNETRIGAGPTIRLACVGVISLLATNGAHGGPFGACCFGPLRCIETSPSSCDKSGGFFLGDGSECLYGLGEGAACPLTVGACCFPGGACQEISADECDRSGGTFAGAFIACEETDCVLAGDIILDPPLIFPAAGFSIHCDAGDLDGDGNPDVVVVLPEVGTSAGPTPGSIQTFENDGNDVSGDWQGLSADDLALVGDTPQAVAIGQLDDDAFPDIAVANFGDGTVTVLFGDGTGAMGSAVTIPVGSGASSAPTDVATGDFTGDGVIDIAVALFGDDALLILQGDGAGSYAEAATFAGGGVGISTIDPEDLEGDKDLDLLAGGRTGGVALIFFQETGGLAAPITIPVGVEPVDITGGDVDGDGDPDVITADAFGGATLGGGSGSTVSVILNNGDGTFEPSFQTAVGSGAQSVKAEDLDGDGDADLAVVANDATLGPGVLVLESFSDTAVPTFSVPIFFSVDADPAFIVATDLNVDGRTDFVTANEDDLLALGGGSVSALLNGFVPILADIPTVSEWGLIVLGLLLLTAGTIVLRRRRLAPA
ncbi:MAG: VCBS repeat-containing protein [Phycisphaerales bacterium]|nr:VCBS repeat-containing protein [Phycisphaerae bacterium]NNF41637.1 VCBS repeat-containing protein [Phycisphaerales bacterium]NNM24816.1 VCBS repeat-containing protein [Phycisphaerales bacterium]